MNIVLGNIVLVSTILIFASIGSFLTERSGIPNISVEAILLVSSFGYAIIHDKMQSQGYGAMFLGIIVSIVIAIVFSWILVLTFIKLRANTILVGTGLNMLSIPLTMSLVKVSAKSSQGINIDLLESMKINNFPWVYLIFLLLGILMIIATIFVMLKTRYGILINGAGENPHALHLAGLKVNSIRFLTGTVGAAFAGVAGALICHFSTGGSSFYKGTTAYGLGFISLGIVILSQWRSKWIGLFAIMFGITFSISYKITYLTNNLNHVQLMMISAIPYLIPIVILPIISKSHNFPKQMGVPFIANKRGE